MKQEFPILNTIKWVNIRLRKSINNFVVHTGVFYYNETDYKIPRFTAGNYACKANTALRIRD